MESGLFPPTACGSWGPTAGLFPATWRIAENCARLLPARRTPAPTSSRSLSNIPENVSLSGIASLYKGGRYIESSLLAGHLRFLECRSRNITRRYLTNTNLDDLHRRDYFELQATTLDRYDFIDVVYQDFVYSFDDSLAFEEVEKSDSRATFLAAASSRHDLGRNQAEA